MEKETEKYKKLKENYEKLKEKYNNLSPEKKVASAAVVGLIVGVGLGYLISKK